MHIFRVIDKKDKVGVDEVKRELETVIGQDEVAINKIIYFVGLNGSNDEVLDWLAKEFSGVPLAEIGIANLREILGKSRSLGIPEENIKIDLSIARGLDYYTGTVYETILNDLPGIGSICSGGRFDNLSSLYTDKELPGVGASIGLDRLIVALQALNLLDGKKSTAEVLVAVKDGCSDYSFSIAGFLRDQGVDVEVYLGQKSVSEQIKYAISKDIKFIVFPSSDGKEVSLKDVGNNKDSDGLSLSQVMELIRKG